jgi:taurine dioxygenase
MAPSDLSFDPLPNAGFGVCVAGLPSTFDAAVERLVTSGPALRAALNAAGGLMIVRGLAPLRNHPEAFVRLAKLFGPEAEDIYQTPTERRFLHDAVREIMVLSNMPPCRHPPPPRPDPAWTDNGALVVSYPEQTNWHTDQSYRRPPPDVTLLLGLITPPPDQGHTLFADCTAAFEALDKDVQDHLAGLEGIHAPGWIGRREEDVIAGLEPKTVLPHQMPQRQPLVRQHPDTGKQSLYICTEKQMDFVDGPIIGLSKGPEGDGAKLLRKLLRHATQPRFCYAHAWRPGDLIIADNRCLLHAATWYDADTHARLMWRITVMGNAGADYAGEAKSWIPQDGTAVDAGMPQG